MTGYSFVLRYTPTVMDGPVLRWYGGRKIGSHQEIFSGETVEDFAFQISASRNGVMLSGSLGAFDSVDAAESVKKIIDEALKAHTRIAASRDQHKTAKEIADAAKQRVE